MYCNYNSETIPLKAKCPSKETIIITLEGDQVDETFMANLMHKLTASQIEVKMFNPKSNCFALLFNGVIPVFPFKEVFNWG